MIAKLNPTTDAWKVENEAGNDALIAEIRALLGKIAKADSKHGVRVVPLYWALGRNLARVEGSLKRKYALAKSRAGYYRALKIHDHFPSLAEARAYRGSLRKLLDSIKEGIEGRQAAPADEKAARALIKAAHGRVDEALLFLVQRHWEIGQALAWLQAVETKQKACERGGEEAARAEDTCDGAAIDAVLNSPPAVAVDSTGDLFIADSGNNVERRFPAAELQAE